MLMRLHILVAAGVLAAACGTAPSASAQHPAAAPRGASIGPEGYATIRDAPPAPFTPSAVGTPAPPSADQVSAQAQFRRIIEFQNRVRPEALTVVRQLRRAKKGNFVDFYFENEGEPKVVFRFLRNGGATLRKYTHNPAFTAETVRYSEAELRKALDFMFAAFAKDRIIEGGGTGTKYNRAVVDLNVTEPEFRAIAARRGVTVPDAVRLNFRPGPPVGSLNRPLPPELARLVRIFPRDDRPTGIVNSINSTAKVVLDDGCFRIADQGGALALLPIGAQLFVDREGYLAFGTAETPGYARVGETVIYEGSPVEVTAPELVEPIHASCGPGKVMKINALRSARADRAQQAATQNRWALKELKESYGLPDADARTVLERCIARAQFGTCHMTPPHPVRAASQCPAGTKLSHGLCRTREGVIRPMPLWIADLLKG